MLDKREICLVLTRFGIMKVGLTLVFGLIKKKILQVWEKSEGLKEKWCEFPSFVYEHNGHFASIYVLPYHSSYMLAQSAYVDARSTSLNRGENEPGAILKRIMPEVMYRK